MKKATLLLIILFAVCANAEYTFDNDKDIHEREDKRDAEREEARKALDRVRFGIKGGGAVAFGIGLFDNEHFDGYPVDGGIMLNFPLSRLNNGNSVLATELNFGHRLTPEGFKEFYLNIPLMFQYVSFFFPTTDIQVHWVPSPKRYVFMHLKTIAEAGAFIDIPFGSEKKLDYKKYGSNPPLEDDKDRNFFDLGVMLGCALQLENIILGARAAASYTDLGGGSSLFLQVKGYLGYLF